MLVSSLSLFVPRNGVFPGTTGRGNSHTCCFLGAFTAGARSLQVRGALLGAPQGACVGAMMGAALVPAVLSSAAMTEVDNESTASK